jgi:hypothetical protein
MKQKVFSHEESMNYNDYLKMKCGETMLKNIKKKNNNACINTFLNYQDFLNITKSYYKYLYYPTCSKHLLTNMYETNQSFIHYQHLLNHLNTCKTCIKDKVESLENIQCNQLLNILYPYGVYEHMKESNIYFPNKVKLTDWCSNNKNKQNCYRSENFIDTFIVNEFPSNKETNNNCGMKYNLCNNTKPLFI